MAKNCALLISSCDKYQDILPAFFTLLRKYWPNLKYQIYLSTESTNYRNKNFKVKNLHPSNPSCSWTERIYDALTKIPSEQIFLLCDDFFLYDKVNDSKIRQIVTWLQNDPKIATFTLWPLLFGAEPSPYPGFSLRSKNAKYKVAVIAGVWNKKWLAKYLSGIKETAWQFEPHANKRSAKMFHPGKFYALLESQEQIFPYDFTKLGLYSGQWLPETKDLFKKHHLKMDFKKRGFFDPVYSSFSRSRQEAFEINSKILPSHYFKHRISFAFPKTSPQSSPTKIYQEYHFPSGQNCFRWCISDIPGFSLSNLAINVTYRDGKTEPVDYSKLVGTFLKVKNRYIFNGDTPYMIVFTRPNIPFSKVLIAADLTIPATRSDLKASFSAFTPQNDETLALAYDQNLYEYALSSECSSLSVMQPKITFLKNNRREISSIIEPLRLKGRFSYSYILPPPTSQITWLSSTNPDHIRFYFSGLTVKLSSKSGQTKTLKLSRKNCLSSPRGHSYFSLIPPVTLNLDTTGYDKITIRGKMSAPIPLHLFRRSKPIKVKIYNIIKTIRRKIWKKSK